MLCLKVADIEHEYEVAMIAIDDASPLLFIQVSRSAKVNYDQRQ